MGSYGFLFMNVAGALGATTFVVRPGALRWVYATCDEAAGSMGSCLMALAVWNGSDEEVARTVVLIVAVAHLVIKNSKHSWMNHFVHGVAHCSMAMMFNVASTSGDMKLMCGAICYGLAFLLKGKGAVQDAVRLHKELGPDEMSYFILSASCWALSECMVERYAKESGLY